MENAGRAVADNVARRHPPGTRVAIAAGPGNNGGDGLVAARLLRERGYRVRVLVLAGVDAFKGDALNALQRGTPHASRQRRPALTAADVIVDALFGAGLGSARGGARPSPDRGNATAARASMPSICRAESMAQPARLWALRFAHRDRHVLPAQGRSRATAWPPALRQHSLADIGLPANVLETIRPRTWANSPPLWLDLFPVPTLLDTNTVGGMPLWSPGGHPPPGLRGLPRAQLCGRERGWSPSPVHGTHLPSMPARTSR